MLRNNPSCFFCDKLAVHGEKPCQESFVSLSTAYKVLFLGDFLHCIVFNVHCRRWPTYLLILIYSLILGIHAKAFLCTYNFLETVLRHVNGSINSYRAYCYVH